MRGHFRYLRFKTFPMTPRKPQCKVFWALLSSSEHSRVPEDSKSPTFPSVGLHPHTWPKWGCDINVDVHMVFGQQIDIMRYHPTIVQFNAMNQKCAPRICVSINRISVYIRHHLGLELAWILFFAFAFFHAWGI
jgi:hypothetical protein